MKYYAELGSIQRHYDTQYWLVPGLNYTAIGLFYNFAFSERVIGTAIQSVVLWFVPVVTLGFIIKLVNEWAYHMDVTARLRAVERKIGVDPKILEVRSGEAWVKRWKSVVDVAKVMLATMALTFVAEIVIALVC